MGVNTTLSIDDNQHDAERDNDAKCLMPLMPNVAFLLFKCGIFWYAECHYAEFCVFIEMLSFVMFNVSFLLKCWVSLYWMLHFYWYATWCFAEYCIFIDKLSVIILNFILVFIPGVLLCWVYILYWDANSCIFINMLIVQWCFLV